MIGFDADVDCSDVAAAAYAAGARFVCRYYKNLSLVEAQALSDAGLKIVGIWETTAKRSLGGALAGTVDGRAALAAAQSLRQPVGSAIAATVDFDATKAEESVVLSYLQAFKACVGGYTLIVYANGAICDAATAAKIADHPWLAGGMGMRGSREFLASGAAMIVQDVGDKRGLSLGINIDTDTADDGVDFGAWSLPRLASPKLTLPRLDSLQSALCVSGYYKGSIDNQWGPLTAGAFSAYYRDHP